MIRTIYLAIKTRGWPFFIQAVNIVLCQGLRVLLIVHQVADEEILLTDHINAAMVGSYPDHHRKPRLSRPGSLSGCVGGRRECPAV